MKSFFCFSSSTSVSDDDKVADCGTHDPNYFSWEEIKKGTRNFSTKIASGGFSSVYLARLHPHSGFTAVKIQSACTHRLARIYDQELQVLLRLRHPNIVKFLGHCDGREEERVLVFEYASNGTLHDKLQHLTWKARVRIAFQLAAALEYLHGMQIIHGDIKASNILLDQHLNCKLCDFGSAMLGFTSMVLPPPSTKMNRMIMGSQGYVDPHYLKTGLVSNKNDVYSYGVVLLELITGRDAAFSWERGEKLTEVVKLGGAGAVAVAVEEVVDPRLTATHFHPEEAKAMLSLATMCIHSSPMLRPCAKHIVASIRDNFTHL